MLQVPELKRAMGFSSNYKLSRGTRRDRVKLLGNGVCPPVMREIVSSLTGEVTATVEDTGKIRRQSRYSNYESNAALV
jgi:DNA (cytosine-5)-methyltransferase 1